jgi:formylmethanofuran dehydrogenase subunit E
MDAAMNGAVRWLILSVVLTGCSAKGAPPAASADDNNEKLMAVARVHGGAGPWAVAGYRMGAYALRTLGIERGSFDFEIVHFTPRQNTLALTTALPPPPARASAN